ncbi:MAG: hypothetical protein WD035_02960, partial [Balneolaceae bacterium]
MFESKVAGLSLQTFFNDRTFDEGICPDLQRMIKCMREALMSLRKFLLFLFSAVLLFPAIPGVVFGQDNIVKKQLEGYGEVEYVEGELIIRYKNNTLLQAENSFREEFDTHLQSVSRFRSSPTERVRLREMSVEEGLERYRNHPDVEYVEPNFVYRLIKPVRQSPEATSGTMQNHGESTIPNDSFFDLQWGLRNDGEDFEVGTEQNRRVVSKTEGA